MIKIDMEMPNTCKECRFHVLTNESGIFGAYEYRCAVTRSIISLQVHTNMMSLDCPLKEVKKHPEEV